MVPVVDLAERLALDVAGRGRWQRGSRCLRVSRDVRELGVVVDAVHGIHPLDPAA